MAVSYDNMQETSSQIGIKMPSNQDKNNNVTGVNRVVFYAFGALLILIAIIAIIVACVAIAKTGTVEYRQMPGGGPSSQQNRGNGASARNNNGNNDDSSSSETVVVQVGKRQILGGMPPGRYQNPRVFAIAVGHDYGAHEYLDNTGYLAGFNLELAEAVCSAARINCITIWAPYTQCILNEEGKTTSKGGKGLMGDWWDACMSWYKTVDRIHMVAYSQAYLEPLESGFWVAAGSNGYSFSSSDKIGFLDGWASDGQCLARNRNGTILDAANSIIYPTTAKLRDAIINGKVKAGFTGKQDLEPHKNDIKYVGNALTSGSGSKPLSCMIDGNAMITKKDNDFNDYFNKGLNIIQNNLKFNRICQRAKDYHGSRGMVRCKGVNVN